VTGRWERLDAALAYAHTGWPVFPCRPESKEPATRNGFYDATTSEGQIRRWWHKEPERNVAIATGAPGPDVVDVDNHGEHDNGFGTLNHLKREGLVGGYHAVVRTPSGGIHLYYRGTSQASGSARGYRIDFRSKGGYIVAPPSTRPEGAYVVAKHGPAAEAGTVSWDAIRGELEPPRPQRQAAAPYPQGDTGTSMDRLVNWVAQRGPGDRNFPLFWAAKQAEQIGALDGGGVERLVDAFARADPGVNREREARRTIESGRQAAQGGGRGPQREPSAEPRPFADLPTASPSGCQPAASAAVAEHQAEAV
jgi:hypothetical protein